MPSNDTTVRFRANISQLKSEMQAATRQIKLVNSEFKAATSGMDDWTKSEEGLTAKLKQLNGVLDQQKRKLVLLDEELTKTMMTEGKNSAAADRLRVAINNQQAAINKTEKELADYNKQLEELPKTTDDVAQATEKASDGFTVFKAALADLIADGIRAGISALKDFAKEAIQVGMSFESSMSNVQAISGATADQMQALTDKAKDLSESSKFSATEIADGFSYMAMAGWKTEEMLGGIEGIMNLAAASGADLATTSDIVTDALTAMGYGAQDAGKLADVMAAASSNANTNVELMGATFQYVAPIVGALGMNMEDTAVAIGLMANAGIKGEKAGTALRSTLNRLSAPPKECAEEMEKLGVSLTNSDGTMKSLNEVIIDLRKAFNGLSETESTAAAKHIAGQEAMSGLLAIVNASDQDFQKLTVAINDSTGAAASMAETMNDNVGGKLTLLKSKVEGIMIKLFERASDSTKRGLETVGEALDKVDWDKAGDAVGKFATKAADFFAYMIRNSSTIITVLKTIGTLFATVFVAQKISATISAVSSLVTVFKTAESATALLSGAMGALGISMSALPIMAVVAALGALYAYGKKNEQEIQAEIEANYGLSESQKRLNDSISETTEELKRMNDARRSEGESIDLNYEKIENMKDAYNDLIDENGNVKAGYEDLAQELLGNLAQGLGTTIENLKENIDLNGKLGTSIDELIEKKKAESKLSAFEDDYNEARKQEVETWRALKDAKASNQEAQKKLNEATEHYNELASQSQFGDVAVKTSRAKKEMEKAQAAFNETNKALEESRQDWAQTQSVIENYDAATEAALKNNVQGMTDSLNKIQNGIVNYGTATKQQLEQQVVDTRTNLEEVREEYAKGIVNDEYLHNAEAALDAAVEQLNQFGEKTGDVGKTAGDNLKGGFGDGMSGLAETVGKIGDSTYNTLEASMGNWDKIGAEKSDALISELDARMGNAKDSGSNLGKAAADGAKDNTPEFKTAGEEGSKEYTGALDNAQGDAKTSGENLSKAGSEGAESAAGDFEKPGISGAERFNQGIASKNSDANKAGIDLASEAAKGADNSKSDFQTSGEHAGEGFIAGIKNWIKNAWDAGVELSKSAVGGVKKGQEEGSPSKITRKSGEFFGKGYVLGIESTKNAVKTAGALIAKSAITSLKQTQKEGSPSKITYESGKMFTQGFINGIASLEGQLVQTTKQLVNKTLAELLKLQNFNFSEVATSASSVFSSGFQKQLDYMIDRINYQNQQMVENYENTVEDLQDASEAAVEAATAKSEKKQKKIQKKIEKNAEKEQTKETKKKAKKLKNQLEKEKKNLDKATDAINESYKNQIDEQNKSKEAYQEASQAMIKEFTQAMNEYQTAAQKLIDDTMNKISDDYQNQYDALVSKQDNLINKLKSAGDLFNLSSANVMTLNDIKAQTAAIKQYASKLQTIKKKVSSELFDQIASYDMQEGEAFIDRLLAMTDQELKAYSDAYDEKMRVSEQLGESTYKSDFDSVAAGYKKAMEQAFAGLPAQLEALGWETMQGFINGLTGNTDYMVQSVRTFIAGMVDTFKEQLGIHSPSKVTMSLGELAGEGFADGILKMVNVVKDAAKDITDAVTDSLDISSQMAQAKNVIGTVSGSTGYNRNAGSFSGGNSQIINFNQVNNSPKALDRLTIYRQTNNMLFNAKVGLSNV